MTCNSPSLYSLLAKSVLVSCLSVSIKKNYIYKYKKRHVDTSDCDFTEYETVILYRAHSAAQRKKLSVKTGSFVVISCSKLDPYQGVRTCNKQFTKWGFIHHLLQTAKHLSHKFC